MSETKNEILRLLRSTGRPGIESLIEYLEKGGFFKSPASYKFHGCYPGGLANHSLRVHELLVKDCIAMKFNKVTAPGQKQLAIGQDHMAIAALLHDVCKMGAYIGTEKPYVWNKKQPKGHALLSIARIKEHIELAEIEEMMIKYHMGVYGLNEFHEKGSWQYKTQAEYPLRGDMTKEESKEARYGKSLANAWYHNPIVKAMYFCDERATLEEKAKE